MIEHAQLTDKSTGQTKEVVEDLQLKSLKVITPTGVGFKVTACPHRNGNPKHKFYEAWFNWEGGTLRSSTVIHDEDTRDLVRNFLHNLTGVDHSVTIDTTLNKYDWHTEAN